MNLSLLKNLNLLYAEDDSFVRNSVTKSLELLCANVYTAGDGQEAIEVFEAKHIDIAILDYVMPKKDGYATLLHIRASKPTLPIIMLSAYTDKEKLLNAISGRVVEYLEKPMDLGRLTSALLKCTERGESIFCGEVCLENDIYYSFEKKSLFRDSQEIHLTHTEVEILECFIKNRGIVISKYTLYECFDAISEGSLRNSLSALRKKLPSTLIETKKDLGYILH